MAIPPTWRVQRQLERVKSLLEYTPSSCTNRNEDVTLIPNGTVLVHFDTDHAYAYQLMSGSPKLIAQQRHSLNGGLLPGGLAEAASAAWDALRRQIDAANGERVRLYATGMVQHLSRADSAELVNGFYVDTGLYFNVVESSLESFYLANGGPDGGSKGMINGLVRQQFRQVVVCGSFQQSLGYIENVIDLVRQTGAVVLSPPSTRVKPDTLGSDFILFDYQDHLKNERDTWRHKYIHMDKFRDADAVIVCNPGGKVGQGTLFELGFMSALSKRVIFTEEPVDVSVLFPSEVGFGPQVFD